MCVCVYTERESELDLGLTEIHKGGQTMRERERIVEREREKGREI